MNNKREIEIDLLDLIRVVLYKWRVVCAFAILGALILGLLQIRSNINNNKLYDAEQLELKALFDERDKMDVEERLVELSVSERASVEEAARYYDIWAKYDSYYNGDESVYIKLDPFKVSEKVLIYKISCRRVDMENDFVIAKMVAYTLSTYIAEGAITKDMAEAGYTSLSEGSVKELISCTYGAVSNSLSSGAEDKDVYVDIDQSAAVNSSIPFVIAIKGENDKQTEEIAEAVRASFEEYAKTLDMLGDFTLSFVTEQSSVIMDKGLIDKQKEYVTYLKSYSDTVKNLTAAYTVEQKDLFNKLTESKYFDGEDALRDDSSKDKTKVATPEVGEAKYSQVSLKAGLIKKVVLGIIIGIFLPAMLIAIKYIFDGKVKTKDEFTRVYGLYLAGDVSVDAVRRGFGKHIDMLLDKIYKVGKISREDRAECAIANIKALAEKFDKKEIVLGSASVLTGEGKAEAERLSEALAKEGINVRIASGLGMSAKSIEEVTSVGNVILTEKLGVSTYSEIDRVLELFAKQDVNVMAVVMV